MHCAFEITRAGTRAAIRKRMRPALCPVLLAGVLAAVASVPATGAEIFGDKGACAPGSKDTAALVTVDGFRDRDGNLRIIAYRALESDYFVSGAYVNRIDTPVTKSGSMTVCARLPGPGKYVVAVLQDRDKSGKFGLRDGVGFAGNPKLPLGKPPLEDVTLAFSGVQKYNVVLNYLQGLSVRPIEGTQSPPPSRFGRGGRR